MDSYGVKPLDSLGACTTTYVEGVICIFKVPAGAVLLPEVATSEDAPTAAGVAPCSAIRDLSMNMGAKVGK